MEEKKDELAELEKVVEQREKKAIEWIKKKKEWIIYILLAFIVWIGVYIRTLNIPRLKDVTTGSWTLGPDLDPFLFLRWAKEIVAKGYLSTIDMMRYVPLGYNTAGEMQLLSYMIAYFHKFLVFFKLSNDITYSAILFPVFMFALTTIAFFLFARKIFYKESKVTQNLIALLSTLIFVLVPSLLPRTIAGIPEKESAAFFFMFLAFYFIIEAFINKEVKNSIIFGILAGLSTGILALIWGGVLFVFLTISLTVLISFAFGKIKPKEIYIYLSWLLVAFMIMIPFSTRYHLTNMINSLSTGFSIAVMIIILTSYLIMKIKKLDALRAKTKLSPELFSLVLSILTLVIIIIIIKPEMILENLGEIYHSLIQPSVNRFNFTVAENKQPYFLGDWQESFGPIINGIPLFFWMFFSGAVFMFINLVKTLNKKERIILNSSYLIFLICLIFSRYSSSSILNGTNSESKIVYFAGWIIFLGTFIYVYWQRNKNHELNIFEEFNFSYLLYFVLLTLSIIGARGGIRLIMVLGAISPIAAGFLFVKRSESFFNEKEETKRLINGIILVVIALPLIFILIGNPLQSGGFSNWGGYYQINKAIAQNYAPSVYTLQWQNAMAWVRNNTPENSVFAHWWDYGYWVQSIGERATVLDGGNAIVYWDHLLGRYVLTGYDDNKALEFMYTHNVTHLLIDSTDIGKYTAFSSIGADENYDRFSWINTFLSDDSKMFESKNETLYFYTGGSVLDEDLKWKENETEIFLPGKKAGIGAIELRKDNNKNEFSQPRGLFVYGGKQYKIPLRYLYNAEEKKLIDYKTGVEAGVFIYPRLDHGANNQLSINPIGAALYLSNRTVHSQIAKRYLFEENSNYFNLAHAESNWVINNLKANNIPIGEFVYYQGFQGPIKIWEINYPQGIKANPEFLKTEYPNEKLRKAKPGEYSN